MKKKKKNFSRFAMVEKSYRDKLNRETSYSLSTQVSAVLLSLISTAPSERTAAGSQAKPTVLYKLDSNKMKSHYEHIPGCHYEDSSLSRK